MSDFQVTVKEVDSVVVIATDGYLNNIGGEKISEVCDEYMDKGKNKFLINLEKSTVVNSIGVSILIEIIEKLQEQSNYRAGLMKNLPEIIKMIEDYQLLIEERTKD